VDPSADFCNVLLPIEVFFPSHFLLPGTPSSSFLLPPCCFCPQKQFFFDAASFSSYSKPPSSGSSSCNLYCAATAPFPKPQRSLSPANHSCSVARALPLSGRLCSFLPPIAPRKFDPSGNYPLFATLDSPPPNDRTIVILLSFAAPFKVLRAVRNPTAPQWGLPARPSPPFLGLRRRNNRPDPPIFSLNLFSSRDIYRCGPPSVECPAAS